MTDRSSLVARSVDIEGTSIHSDYQSLAYPPCANGAKRVGCPLKTKHY